MTASVIASDLPLVTPASRYTWELVKRLNAALGMKEQEVRQVLCLALHEIQQDLVKGRPVPLEHLGEFAVIDLPDPVVRYQADNRLIERLCINNLKIKQGESQHG